MLGSGDNRSMFEPLKETDLARQLKLLPINLPGFGEPSLSVTSLDTLADVINERAIQQSAEVVMVTLWLPSLPLSPQPKMIHPFKHYLT